MIYSIVQFSFIVATALFVFALHWMKDPKTARKGVFSGVAAMTIAIISTLIDPAIVNWEWIAVAIAFGFIVGIPLSKVPLTAVPQRTALSHAFGGLAAGLVGTAKFYLWLDEGPENLTVFIMVAIIA